MANESKGFTKEELQKILKAIMEAKKQVGEVVTLAELHTGDEVEILHDGRKPEDIN